MMEKPWSKEAVYDERIAPLMTEIIQLCREHEIPMVAVFQYEDTEEEGPGYCTTILPFPHQDEHMKRLNQEAKPKQPVTLAATIQTRPDGSKLATITRIS